MEIIIPESPNWVIPTAGAGSLRTAGFRAKMGTDERECFSEVCGIGDSDGEVQLADMTEVVKDLPDNFPIGNDHS